MSDSARASNETVWRARVRAWEASGLSTAQFARRHGFSASTLRNWASRRKRPAAPQFLRLVPKAPTVPPAPATTRPVVIEVGTARVLVTSGFDAALLRDVVRALGEGAR
jgi:lambda repressor-like predicted transcriptional regulator